MNAAIKSDLDKLIKRAQACKVESLKKAADTSGKIDGADDGTSVATTGEQASANTAAAGETTGNSVDGGAADSKANASVTKNTDGSDAANPSGKAGPGAGEFAVKKEADNGAETKDDAVAGNNGATGAFKTAAAELRKLAGELRKTAGALISPFENFLCATIRTSPDAQVKKAAEAMSDADLANNASDVLISQIEQGAVSEEEAAKLLQDAIAQGAISEEEVQQAAQEMGAAAGGAIPPEAGAIPPEAGAIPPEEAALQQKLAFAMVTPDSPDYMKKLASLYPDVIEQGHAFGLKLAEELSEEEDGEKEEEEEGEKEEEEEGEKEENAVPSGDPGAVAAPVANVGATGAVTPGPDEQAALAAVQQQLGLTPEQMQEIMAAPVPQLPPEQLKMAAARAKVFEKLAMLQESILAKQAK